MGGRSHRFQPLSPRSTLTLVSTSAPFGIQTDNDEHRQPDPNRAFPTPPRKFRLDRPLSSLSDRFVPYLIPCLPQFMVISHLVYGVPFE